MNMQQRKKRWLRLPFNPTFIYLKCSWNTCVSSPNLLQHACLHFYQSEGVFLKVYFYLSISFLKSTNHLAQYHLDILADETRRSPRGPLKNSALKLVLSHSRKRPFLEGKLCTPAAGILQWFQQSFHQQFSYKNNIIQSQQSIKTWSS